jgi:hypothetical protein
MSFTGLTAAYRGTGYSGGIVTVETYIAAANKGFYSTIVNGSTLTAGSQTIEAVASPYMARYDINIGASAGRDYTTAFLPFANGASGPWCSLYSAATVSGTTNGFSTTTMLALGGRDARTHAVALQNQSNQYLTSIFQALAEHAGYTNASDSPLLIRIVGGVNDTVATGTTSVGPSAGYTSSTVEGLADNWQAIINRVHAVYDSNSWSRSNLYWLITASAPRASNDSDLSFARQAAQLVSDRNDRVAAVDLYELVEDFADVTGLAGREAGGAYDYSHPSRHGFRVYSQIEWESLQAAFNNLSSSTITSPGGATLGETVVYFGGKIYTQKEFETIRRAFYQSR